MGAHSNRPNELRGVEEDWLPEPTQWVSSTPNSTSSLEELSVPSYTCNTNSDQLFRDIRHCNKALRILTKQNSQLHGKLELATKETEDGEDQIVPVAKETMVSKSKKSISYYKQEKRPRRQNFALSASSSSSSSISSASSSDLAIDEVTRKQKQNMTRPWLTDQDGAVRAYRELLGELGKQMCAMELQMARMARETQCLRAAALLDREERDEQELESEHGRMAMLDHMRRQIDEAEMTCLELREQLDDVERRAHRNKSRADARIAELNLIIATSHLDLQCLRNENMALKDQLAFGCYPSRQKDEDERYVSTFEI